MPEATELPTYDPCETDLGDLDAKVSMLNPEQREIVDRIMGFLRHRYKCRSADCDCPRKGCSPDEPIREFVTGVGGTG